MYKRQTLSYTDTADTFKIQKDSKGYFLTKYIDESAEQDGSGSIKEEKVRLRLEKKVFLREVAKDGDYAYAYDTKLKKVVIINPHNNYRIMTVVEMCIRDRVEGNTPDPHVWFNTEFWGKEAEALANKLAEMDSKNADYYKQNYENYKKELAELTEYVKGRINEIPRCV